MRINVYAEELTTETELVIKQVTDEAFGTRYFYGVRVFLESPGTLHNEPGDDDRSAITFWVPWTKVGGHDFPTVRKALEAMNLRVEEAMLTEDAREENRVKLAAIAEGVRAGIAEVIG